MLIDEYHRRINHQVQTVETTQREVCVEAGKLMAACVAKGGGVHVFDTGHIIDHELIYRGGGLLLLKQFKFSLQIENPVRERDRSGLDRSMEGLAAYALKASGALPGDVLFIGSVSGKTRNVIDLALAAKAFGLTVIAVTSLTYSRSVESEHSSGKRLFECADITLDNCTPAAEAMLDVEGLDAPFAAASGISAALLLWSCCAACVEEMLARGLQPSVLRSQNFPGGAEYNEMLHKRYAETGL